MKMDNGSKALNTDTSEDIKDFILQLKKKKNHQKSFYLMDDSPYNMIPRPEFTFFWFSLVCSREGIEYTKYYVLLSFI